MPRSAAGAFDGLAVDHDLRLPDRHEARNRVQHGGFAATGRSKQTDEFSGFNGKSEAFDRRIGAETHGEVADIHAP